MDVVVVAAVVCGGLVPVAEDVFGFVVVVIVRAFDEEEMELADDEVTCEPPACERDDGPGDGGPAVEALYVD